MLGIRNEQAAQRSWIGFGQGFSLESVEYYRESEAIRRTGSWEVAHLFERGRKNEELCSRCPTTARIIEEYSSVRTFAGLAYLSKLGPGTQVAKHCGPTNLKLRCNLGIQVAKGDCGIRVADEERNREPGKCIVFDDHFNHESWNRTAEARIVLVIDLWHWDLTSAEITLLEGLHRYALAHADNLYRYWIATEKAREASRAKLDEEFLIASRRSN